MADTKISNLTAMTTAVSADMLPIVENASTTTKKITFANFFASLFGNVSSTELSYLDGVTSAIQTQMDTKAPLASPTFTGTPTLPTGTVATTQSAGDSSTKVATTEFVQQEKFGYVLNGNMVASSTSTMAASTTSYFGSGVNFTLTTTADTRKIFIPKAGTIKNIGYNLRTTGTASSGELATFSLRLNNTSDTTLFTNAISSSSTAAFVTGLSIAVVAGDYIEFKISQPAWSTLPNQPSVYINIYIE